jgi:neutral ceramidase
MGAAVGGGDPMRVGHGWAPLSVADGTPMAGYAARADRSSGVLDALEVHCVVIGGLTLVVADMLAADTALTARVRAAIGGDVWLCATHTHSGPGGEAAAAALVDAAVSAARAASASARDCAGALHTGVLRGVGSRRGAAGDPVVHVDVLRFGDDGVLAVVPIHPTVLPASSTAISGDLAAAIRSSLRRQLPGEPWVVAATGAAGDISTRRIRRAQTPAELQRLGAEAAGQIAALVRSEPTVLWEAGASASAVAYDSLALPAVRRDADELAALGARLATALHTVPAAERRTVETALEGVQLATAPPLRDTIDLQLAAARLGRLALLAIGAEPFHSLAGELRARLGPAVLLGYANGDAGYLPDCAADGAGYEALASRLRPDAAARTVAALIDLLPNPTEDP